MDKIIDDDPYEEDSISYEIVKEVRERKRLNPLPSKEHYVDRL